MFVGKEGMLEQLTRLAKQGVHPLEAGSFGSRIELDSWTAILWNTTQRRLKHLRRSTCFIPFGSVGGVRSYHYVAFDEECSTDIEHVWVWVWSLNQRPENSLCGSKVLTRSHGELPGISVNEKACPRGEDAASPVQFRHGGHC